MTRETKLDLTICATVIVASVMALIYLGAIGFYQQLASDVRNILESVSL